MFAPLDQKTLACSPEAVIEHLKMFCFRISVEILDIYPNFPKVQGLYFFMTCCICIKELLSRNNWEKNSGLAFRDRKFHWHRFAVLPDTLVL